VVSIPPRLSPPSKRVRRRRDIAVFPVSAPSPLSLPTRAPVAPTRAATGTRSRAAPRTQAALAPAPLPSRSMRFHALPAPSTHRREASTARLRSTVRATSARSAASFGNNVTGRTCDAVPNDSPLAIWQNENDHRQPFPGDHGIPFSPVTRDGPSRGATWLHAGGLRGSLLAPPRVMRAVAIRGG
jgi:hypothetical protein